MLQIIILTWLELTFFFIDYVLVFCRFSTQNLIQTIEQGMLQRAFWICSKVLTLSLSHHRRSILTKWSVWTITVFKINWIQNSFRGFTSSPPSSEASCAQRRVLTTANMSQEKVNGLVTNHVKLGKCKKKNITKQKSY